MEAAHVPSNQEPERDDWRCSALSPFLIQSGTPPSGIVPPAFRARLPSAKPFWKHHRHARKSDSQVFLNLVKLTAMINSYDG